MTAVRQIEFGGFTDEQVRVQRAGEALHRDGASPAGALELLAALVEDGTWERQTDAKGRSFKGRFRDFVEARSPFGLGYDADQLPKVLALRHPHESVPAIAYRMAAMREEVRTLLLAEIAAAPPVGRPGKGSATPIIAAPQGSSRGHKRDAAEVVARLRRDDPELAERVVRGEMTPNAAAQEKGWRKPRILLTSPERIAESLRRYMPREALLRLAELLTKEDE